MKKFITYILALGSASFLLEGCGNFHAPYTVNTGNEIESEISNTINDLDIKLFQYLKGGEFDAMYAISTNDLVKRIKEDTNGLLPSLCRGLQGKSYSVFDEFYITSILPNTPVTITSLRDRDDCKVSFTAPAAKTDLSMLTVGDSSYEYLLSALYTQTGSDWLLHDINIGLYAVAGLDAPALYAKARHFYKAHDLIDAANYMLICKQCLNPLDTNWRYNDAEAMERFANRLVKEAQRKYSFPTIAKEIKTAPTIFGIAMRPLHAHLCPHVYYVSSIPLKDTAALRQENLQLRKFARSTFAPMHDNNTVVVYRAFNESADGKKSTLSYGFIEDL